ncbi:hypothetical protein ACHAWU_006130 [Discostella pseudostelligera]|uniref:Uncharacterized protein n=1 Tax=Discostella pseudostelligera TaxID=259834 RepID=A0ABD3M6L3_9STRA
MAAAPHRQRSLGKSASGGGGSSRLSVTIIKLLLLASTGMYVALFLRMDNLDKKHSSLRRIDSILMDAPQQTNNNDETRHPRVYELEDLHQIKVEHGIFFFGPHSHQVVLDPTYDPAFTSIQQQYLDDETIDVEKEKERCARYNYQILNEDNPKRRRIFYGAMVGDDTLEVLRAVGTEGYNIFHTVSFIEGNSTHSLQPKKWKYYDPVAPSKQLNTLYQLFGPKTKVSVDYYSTNVDGLYGRSSDCFLDFLQREGNSHRWAMNGMRGDDIAIVADADETFTRDFLRAMQICDIPQFRPNQDCLNSKLIGSTMVLESSPNCIDKDRRWYHPDAIIGECFVNIGNSTSHPPAKRDYKDRHSLRSTGYGMGDYSKYWAENGLEKDSGIYPLWTEGDMKMEGSSAVPQMKDESPTAFHFHNYFNSAEAIHFKYLTYGHAKHDAMDKPIWELHEDLQLGVDCANGLNSRAVAFTDSSSSVLPIYYMNEDVRSRRHELWKSIVKDEEKFWNAHKSDGKDADDSSPSDERRSRVYDMEELERIEVAHGTFFFGPHSHQVDIDATYDPSFTSSQLELLDDDIIDVEKEKERCARYNYQILNEDNPKRRRLFYGAMVGDDSMEVLRAVSTEAYNIFHTVSFIEGNSTHSLKPKKWKYYDPVAPSKNLNTLYQMFGPKSKVSVDYYSTNVTELHGRHSDLFLDFLQREGNSHRWAMNGMREDDIGIVTDADETFTRDYLRAMQICDIPAFRPNLSCRDAKVLASTMVMESSPNCVDKDRRWFHPDAILGECMANVGNSSLHPPALREYEDWHGLRIDGSRGSNYSKYWAEYGLDEFSAYPLYTEADMKMEGGAEHPSMKDGSPTGYHFHNYFSSAEAIHVKYHTYGHAAHDAMDKPIWELHEDIELGVDCAHGLSSRAVPFTEAISSVMPIYYMNEEVRNKRHGHWKSIVKDEEEYWSDHVKERTDKYDVSKYLASIDKEDFKTSRNDTRHPIEYELEQLKHIEVEHGTFFFGPHSHQVDVDHTYDPSFTTDQQELLNDNKIDVKTEKERCARYNYQISDENHPKRRRIFYGAMVGDDSMEVLRAVSTEAYNIFHTVSFIEGNSTHSLKPKRWKYYDPDGPSKNLNTLYQMFGPKSKVSVDYYVTSVDGLYGGHSDLFLDFLQREGNSHRWAMNGMREDDIGIIADADETFTRDYLRAMQICDIPEFRPNQDCLNSKVFASTMVLESSPNCITKDRRWFHPDAILGECVENVGDSSLHPSTKREYKDHHGMRIHGYGKSEDFVNNFTLYWAENGLDPANGTYPLWTEADMKMESLGVQPTMKDGSPTGYHFHNYFNSAEAIHVKYHTYGHAAHDAMEKPIWELHEDLQLAVDCANGVGNDALDFSNTDSSVLPIYYRNDEVRSKRHELWQSIVKEEEKYWQDAHNKSGEEKYDAEKYLQSKS